MHIGDEKSPPWVIESATYFDHRTHRFTVGDIEIDGEWIASIEPPGASRVPHVLDGRDRVVTPGLMRAHAEPLRFERDADRLLQAGVTTAALVCATASACVLAANRMPQRLCAALLLNAFSRARTLQQGANSDVPSQEVRVFERIAAQLRNNGTHLLPAVQCASILSAQELVYAQNFAAALGRKLAVVLSDSPQAAQAFRERFYCSEMQLLAFLQLPPSETTVWGLSQLTRRDVDLLRGWGADALPAMAPWADARRHGQLPPSLPCRYDCRANGGSQPDPLLATTAGLRGVGPRMAADVQVDAWTASAAAALGDPRSGRIAPGMRADLCVFSSGGAAPCLRGLGSEAFLQLLQFRKPDVVLVGGRVVHGAARTSSRETAPAAMYRPHGKAAHRSHANP